MICNSYWKLYHYGTCMMMLRAVRDVLMASTLHARFESCGDTSQPLCMQTLVYACQTVRNYPGIFARMKRVEACIESHEGHFEH
jgi:hypothetical protein